MDQSWTFLIDIFGTSAKTRQSKQASSWSCWNTQGSWAPQHTLLSSFRSKTIWHRQRPRPWLFYATSLSQVHNSAVKKLWYQTLGAPWQFQNTLWCSEIIEQGCQTGWLELYPRPVFSGRDYQQDNFSQLCIRELGCHSGYPNINRLSKTLWPNWFGLGFLSPCSLTQFLHVPVSFCWSLGKILDQKLCLLNPMDNSNLWGREDVLAFCL